MELFINYIYDIKAEAMHGQPFFTRARGETLRLWADMANNKQGAIGKHPSDYILYESGTINQLTGTLMPHDEKVNLGTAAGYVEAND